MFLKKNIKVLGILFIISFFQIFIFTELFLPRLNLLRILRFGLVDIFIAIGVWGIVNICLLCIFFFYKKRNGLTWNAFLYVILLIVMDMCIHNKEKKIDYIIVPYEKWYCKINRDDSQESPIPYIINNISKDVEVFFNRDFLPTTTSREKLLDYFGIDSSQ